MAKLNIPAGIAQAINAGKIVIWAQKDAGGKLLPRVNDLCDTGKKISGVISACFPHFLTGVSSDGKLVQHLLKLHYNIDSISPDNVFIDINLWEDCSYDLRDFDKARQINWFNADFNHKMECHEHFYTADNGARYSFSEPEVPEETADAEIEDYLVNPTAFDLATQTEIENAVKNEVAKVVAEVMLKVPALMKQGYSAQAAQAQLLVEKSWCYYDSRYCAPTIEAKRKIDYYKGLKVLRAKSKARLQEAEALLKKIEDEDSRKALIRNKLFEMAEAVRIAPEDDGSNDEQDEVEYEVPAVVENDDDDELIDAPEIENADDYKCGREIVKAEFEIGNYYKATDAETCEIAPSAWLVDIRGNKAIFRTDSDEFFNGNIVTEKGVQTVTAQMPDFGKVIVSAIKDTFIAEAEYEPYDEETLFAEYKDIVKTEILIEVRHLIDNLNATAINVTTLADIVNILQSKSA